MPVIHSEALPFLLRYQQFLPSSPAAGTTSSNPSNPPNEPPTRITLVDRETTDDNYGPPRRQ